MTEIELKFQVPSRSRAPRRGGGGRARRHGAQALRLQAAYFDSADGRLAAAAGVALRLRREGARRCRR